MLGIQHRPSWLTVLTPIALLMALPAIACAHGVTEGDQSFMEQSEGVHLFPYAYLGAKHMVTGYDHILFLIGVIFFLYRMKNIAIYVTLFSIGHSLTLLLGVLGGFHVNSYIVDAIIGLSVVYKGLDNINAFKRWFGFQPSTKGMVLIFGFFHGFGLAAKVQDFNLSSDGLVWNILAFNVGVEIGQLLALAFVLIAMSYWRKSPAYEKHAFASNVSLMAAGFLLFGWQLTGYFASPVN
ncbi:MAG: HupE/UreJ family protein [Planctomycetota bacterium]|jgi:hypothetical protein|nr:HupE/UreJ family protein [Planctomycetota bacterium]